MKSAYITYSRVKYSAVCILEHVRMWAPGGDLKTAGSFQVPETEDELVGADDSRRCHVSSADHGVSLGFTKQRFRQL